MNFKFDDKDYNSEKLSDKGKLYLGKLQQIQDKQQQLNLEMADEEAADRQSAVDRNVEHLELMVAKDFWTDESMTAVNSAISAGKSYTA